MPGRQQLHDDMRPDIARPARDTYQHRGTVVDRSCTANTVNLLGGSSAHTRGPHGTICTWALPLAGRRSLCYAGGPIVVPRPVAGLAPPTFINGEPPHWEGNCREKSDRYPHVAQLRRRPRMAPPLSAAGGSATAHGCSAALRFLLLKQDRESERERESKAERVTS